MRHLSSLLVIALILAGCNLSPASSETTGTNTPPATRTLTIQDAANTPSSSNSVRPATEIQILDLTATEDNCEPRDDWFEYTIQRGDNLTRIADITNSTVDELIAANCLDNPNRIRVGQTIYVPNEPDEP